MPYKSGDIFLNKYRVKALVGRGAFGEVYHVIHIKLGVPRAVKVLRRDTPGIGSQDFQKARERFEFEAQLGAKLDHPNVVKVYDFEETGGELCLVMEYVPGGSLRDHLDQEGPLSVEEAAKLGLDVCEGLQVIHTKLRAVHRDLKPSNIIFDEHGSAKIADLGLAQVADDTSRRSMLGSLAGAQPGTPLYMSPEQEISRGQLLPSSDVFSLGCVLFEALTGIAYKDGYGTRVRDHHPEAPAWLDEIVSRTLAERPGRVPTDDEDTTKRYRKTEFLQKALQQGREKEKLGTFFEKTPRWGWVSGIVIILIIVVGFIFWGTLAPVSTVTPTSYAEVAVFENEPISTYTSTITPTSTQTPTNTIWITPSTTQTIPPTVTETITPTPTLMAGATQISPVDGMVMIYIPEGEFLMGSDVEVSIDECLKLYEETVYTCVNSRFMDKVPAHYVSLDAYYIDKFEITNAQYANCVNEGECTRPYLISMYESPQYTEHPVVLINWYAANTYCKWRGARLPSEAEWEKAARGTDGRYYPWGKHFNGDLTNFCDRSCTKYYSNQDYDDGYGSIAPVGSYPDGASPYGVLDMAGNVGEWVADWYDNNYYVDSPKENPHGPSSGSSRGVRGGSYYSDDIGVSVTSRSSYGPDFKTVYYGFRCAMDTEP